MYDARMLRRTALIAWASVCLSGTLSVTQVAHAQASAEEKAAAEAVFEEGIRLIKQGNFSAACPKFEMSQRVEPAVGTMLYLAECYERTNRSASSWAMFKEAASLAETSGQTERMKTAQARAARLEPRLSWLIIQVSKEALVPGLQIKRNSVPVSVELSGTPTPVDPGEVVVDASAPGRVPFSSKVTVATKARVSVTIPALAPSPAAAPVVAPPPTTTEAPAVTAPVVPPPAVSASASPAPPAGPAPAAHASPIPWVVGGVGVLALGVGSYFGLKAMSNASDARDTCPKALCNEQQGQTAADDARSAAKISNVSFAIGAAALATGVVLFFTLPTKEQAQVGLQPMVDPSTVGLSLRGRLAL